MKTSWMTIAYVGGHTAHFTAGADTLRPLLKRGRRFDCRTGTNAKREFKNCRLRLKKDMQYPASGLARATTVKETLFTETPDGVMIVLKTRDKVRPSI